MNRIAFFGSLGGIALLSVFFLSSCASWGRTETGAVIGGTTGAVVGGVIGSQTGSTARGAIIGREMDKQAEELEQAIPNATVERVGEGIQVTFDSGILFDFDSSALRPEAQRHLTELAASLREYDDSEVLIVGHTDSVGTEEYNQGLSERRAQSAGNFLVRAGVAPDRVRTMGLGELEPVASNETAAGRQENRRVEVAIFASEEYRRRLTGREE